MKSNSELNSELTSNKNKLKIRRLSENPSTNFYSSDIAASSLKVGQITSK